MTFVSKAAMAAALAVGMTAAVSVPPAFAGAAKQKKEEAPKLELSKEFRTPAAAAQKALEANDLATAKTQIAAAQAVAKNSDEQYFAAQLQLSLAAKSQDTAAMKPALDTLIKNDRVSQADKGKYNFVLAQIATNDKDPKAALQYLQTAKSLGYTSPDMDLLETQLQAKAGDSASAVASLDKSIKAQIAQGKKPEESLYKFGVAQAYKSGNKAATADWLGRWIKAYPTSENWRQVIAVTRQNFDTAQSPMTKDERLDTLRLMRATGALSSESDYAEYADLASMMGLPYETKALIAEGRASGKLSGSNATITQLATSADKSIKADKSLDALEKQAMAGSNGKLAAQTADAYLANGNYAKAIELYQAALTKGGVDTPTVNTRLGIALAESGQTAQASSQFAKVNGTGARGAIANLWQTYVETKGGATAGTSATTTTNASASTSN